MEENNKEKCEGKCEHEGGKCGMMWHGHHMHKCWILKKIFLLIVLIVVFCFGMRLGELRTLSREFRGMQESRMMRYGGGWNQGGNIGIVVPQQQGSNQDQQSARQPQVK